MKLVSILSRLTSAVIVLVIVPAMASAQTFSETGLGDFSGDSMSPTALGQLLLGTNTISGTTGFGDRDIINFVVSPGQEVTSFLITEFSEAGGHFFGLDDSAIAPTTQADFLFAGLVADPSGGPGLQLLGSSGGIVFGTGGSGVPTVLSAGTYTAFFNETGGVSPNYNAEIVVTSAVPEPGSAVMLLGLAGLGMMRRRRK